MPDQERVVVGDAEVVEHLAAGDAVRWMEEALVRRAAGTLVSPPRLRAPLGEGALVLTAGASGSDWYGFRAYDTLPTLDGQGLVSVFDRRSGRVLGLAIGQELGARRTGALGGVAARHLLHRRPSTVGIVGAGTQAWTQLWALVGALGPVDVRVSSRTAGSRTSFADRAARLLGVDARAVDHPRDAVEGADLVVLATSSAEPVVETGWISPDAVVTTLGPKQVGRAEFPPDLVSGASLVVTDSLDQLHAYDPPALAAGHHGTVDLAQVVTGAVAVPHEGRRVYLSVGLAGTEVHLLGRLLEHLGPRDG